MRVPIKHNLTKEEVRHRLRSRSHEIGDAVPGGAAQVEVAWPDEDTMSVGVVTMGQSLQSRVLIEDAQVVFEVDLPAALSFVAPMIKTAIRSKGEKLLNAPEN